MFAFTSANCATIEHGIGLPLTIAVFSDEPDERLLLDVALRLFLFFSDAFLFQYLASFLQVSAIFTLFGTPLSKLKDSNTLS